MRFKLIPLNDSKKQYQFDLTKISGQDWIAFMKDLILVNAVDAQNIEIYDINISIRDNIAKVKVQYQDDVFHNITMKIDEWGLSQFEPNSVSSILWRDVMIKYFAEDYKACLEDKIYDLESM